MAQDTRRKAISWPDKRNLGSRADYRRTFETLRGSPRPIETVTIGGKVYRETDDGRQRKLDAVGPSDAELAEARRTAARIQAMLNSPLGAGAYGIASLAGASPQARDMALAAGSAADSLMMGAAPRGATAAHPAPTVRREPAPPLVKQPSIRYRDSNALEQAQGAYAMLEPSMLGTGTKADRRLRPPGWSGQGNAFKEARGHLAANVYGGTGEFLHNIVTLAQETNRRMWDVFERPVRDRVRGGEIVNYSSIPLYQDGRLPPDALLLTATGSNQAPTARLIYNGAGRR